MSMPEHDDCKQSRSLNQPEKHPKDMSCKSKDSLAGATPDSLHVNQQIRA
jgi:hypothetical protein